MVEMTEQAVNRIIHNMVDTALYLAGKCYASAERTRAELDKIAAKGEQSKDEKYKLEIVMRYMDDGINTAAMILNELYGTPGDHQRIISAIKATGQRFTEIHHATDRVDVFERALADTYEQQGTDYAALAAQLLADFTSKRRQPLVTERKAPDHNGLPAIIGIKAIPGMDGGRKYFIQRGTLQADGAMHVCSENEEISEKEAFEISKVLKNGIVQTDYYFGVQTNA